jgi:hypothetical protein
MELDRVSTGLLVTNLGRLDFPTAAGDVELESIYGPSVCSDTMEKYLGLLTVGGRLHYMLSFDEALVSETVVNQVRQEAMRHLADAYTT